MQEFWAGFAAFIKSFWNQAARQGFSIMLLIITNVGFIFWIDRLNSDMKNGLDDCNAARIRLEAQNATLLAFMKQKR